jgi:hypothetical protein
MKQIGDSVAGLEVHRDTVVPCGRTESRGGGDQTVLLDYDESLGQVGGLAERSRGDNCGYGSDGRVLETGVLLSLRRATDLPS